MILYNKDKLRGTNLKTSGVEKRKRGHGGQNIMWSCDVHTDKLEHKMVSWLQKWQKEARTIFLNFCVVGAEKKIARKIFCRCNFSHKNPFSVQIYL